MEVAFGIDAEFKKMALDDPDLDPIFGKYSFENVPTNVPPQPPKTDPHDRKNRFRRTDRSRHRRAGRGPASRLPARWMVPERTQEPRRAHTGPIPAHRNSLGQLSTANRMEVEVTAR